MDVQEYSVKISPLFAEPEKIQSYLEDNNFSDITKIILDENSFQVAFTDYNRAVALKNFIDGQIIAATQIHAEDPILLPLDEPSPHPSQPPSTSLSPPPLQQFRRNDDERELRERERDRDYMRPPEYPMRREPYPPRHDLPPPPPSHHPYMREELPPPPRRDKYYGRDELYSRTLIVKGYSLPITKRDVWNDFKTFGYLKQIEVRDTNVYLQYDTNDDAYNAMMQARKHDSPLNKLIVELIPDRPLNIPRFVIPLVVEDDPRGLIGEREPRH